MERLEKAKKTRTRSAGENRKEETADGEKKNGGRKWHQIIGATTAKYDWRRLKRRQEMAIKEHKKAASKMREQSRKVDYLCRALRDEERPLLFKTRQRNESFRKEVFRNERQGSSREAPYQVGGSK